MEYSILIFGGTTEGLIVSRLLDHLNEPYIYCTKTVTKQKIKGEVRTGAMTQADLVALIDECAVKLIIDAAHPFAEILHHMILDVCSLKKVETIRYERCFPSLEHEEVKTFVSYDEMESYILEQKYQNILALTGVQTIPKMTKLWEMTSTVFRILDTAKSLELARASGIPLSCIIQEAPSDSVQAILDIARNMNAEVILTKESGQSGFFESKLEAARCLGIPLFVVKRPTYEGYCHTVDSQKSMLQLIYRLRRTCIKTQVLRSGYTTGSTLTAAAQAALTSLLLQKTCSSEHVDIACGERVNFLCYENSRSDTKASYVVIKNGGDDPDVTHAHEIGCTVELTSEVGVVFCQGQGVGRVTMPGLQIEVGEPAINPVPRQMICLMLEHVSSQYAYEGGVRVTPFVPQGEDIAKRTFNPRVGVLGGISIIGTTGKVMPYSSEAFIDAIAKQLKVAEETKCDTVLATSGLRSEHKIAPLLNSSTYTAVHFGNFIGETLKLCHSQSIERVVVGLMLGKAIKLAQGHLDTHSKHATFSVDFVVDTLRACNYSELVIEKAKTIHLANELTSFIPFTENEPFYIKISRLCHQHCSQLLHNGVRFQLYLISANDVNMILAEKRFK